MKVKKAPGFYKFYKGLMMAFKLPESAFMAYMADQNQLREKGHNTVRPMRTHLNRLGIGRRTFEHCVEKCMRMGLLERIPIDGMFEYVWDMRVYDKLLRIVNASSSYLALQDFCDRVFEKEQRSVSSVTEEEIEKLANQ